MKLPITEWKSTLRTLGYRVVRKKPSLRAGERRTGPQGYGNLEKRQLLAGDFGIVVQASLDEALATVANPVVVRLGDFNGDVHQDAAIVSSSGQLTVALNGGDGTWRTRQTTLLTSGSVLGMEVSLVNGDAAPDLILQTPDQLLIALNSGTGLFTVAQTLTPFPPGEMARPVNAGPARMLVTDLDGDLFADLVVTAPQSNQVAVFFANGDGTFALPVIEHSGGVGPVTTAAGNFAGSALPDILVGHTDGSLHFLENAGSRSFDLRLDLSRQVVAPVVDLAASDLDADGDTDVVAMSPASVQVLKNERAELAAGPILPNAGFESGLAGWDVDIRGHRTAGEAGQVLATAGRIQLVENGSFLVSVNKGFVVPASPERLEIDLAAIGLEPAAGGIPDAFELSLLDPAGNSLVPVHRSGATSFFNVNPGGVTELASGVTFNGRTVTVNLSAIPAGTAARLFLDLVGNGPGTGSTVTVEGVRIAPESFFDSSFETIPLAGVWNQLSQLQIDDVDGDARQDMVLLDNGAGVLHVLNGRGGLQFDSDEIAFPAGTSGLVSMDSAPLTSGDGVADLVVLAAGTQQLLSPLTTDTAAPTATLLSPVPNATNTGEVSRIEVGFSEAMRALGAADPQSVTHTANYTLRFLGPDGVEGTGDDELIPIATARYNPLTSTVMLHIEPGSTPLDDGVYRLELDTTRLRDDSDNRLADGAMLVFQFTMNPDGPVIAPIAPLASREGEIVTVMTAFTDAGGQTPYSATIAWGDGSLTELNLLNFSNGQGTLAATHIYADNGVYQISLTVRDAAAVATQAFTSVTVSNVVPALQPVAATISAIRNQPLSQVLASFADPGFDNVNTFTVESFSATIDWGDGTTSAGTVQWTAGIPGTPTSGTVAGQHLWSEAGTFTVTVTLTDDDGGEVSVAIQVLVENDAPVVSVASLSGDEGSSVALSAQFTDLGSNGQFLATIDWGDGSSSPGTITMVNGGGTVSGAHVYADNGTWLVSVTVTDADSNTGLDTANAYIANAAPAIDPLADRTVTFGQPVQLAVRATDPGFTTTTTSETLVATVEWGDGMSDHNVAVTVVPGSAGVDSVGTFTISHTYTSAGSFSAVVTVRDDDGGVATRTVLILVQNFEPVLGGLTPVAAAEGSTLSFAASFTDVRPNQTYTATVSWGDGATSLATVAFVSGTGNITAQHVYADNGSYPLTVTLVDSTSQSVSATTTATIANVAPQLQMPNDVSVEKGQPLAVANVAFSDPGFTGGMTSETLVATFGWGDGTTSAATMSVVNGGPGEPTAGTLSGGHTWTAAGVYPVALTLADDDGGSTTVTFHVTVTDPGGGGNPANTRFFVVDKTSDRIFRYRQNGTGAGSFVTTGSQNARGITTWISGNPVWVIDQDRRVYVYDTGNNGLLGSWKANTINNPEGIATDGTGIWIVDQASRRVYYYANAASRRSGSVNPTSSFALHSGNCNPSDITTDGVRIWVVDHTDDKVYVYSRNGNYQRSWELDSRNRNATGIAISPTGAPGIWVVDKVDDRVYAYPTALPTGHCQTASGWFPLHSNNRNPEGLADPVDPYTIGNVASGTTTALGEVREFAFSGSAGQFLFFDALTTNATRFHWNVRNPDGTTLFSQPSGMTHHDRTQLAQTGTYLLTVTSRVATSSTFLFQVNDVTATNTTAIAQEQLVSGSLTVAGSIREYTFGGTAGQQLYFDTLGTDQSQFNWRVRNPDGSLLFTDALMRDRDTTILPASGTYTLTVDGTLNRTGSYQFQIRNVPATTSTPVTFGQAVGGALVPGEIREFTFSGSAGMEVFLDMQTLTGTTAQFTSSLIAPNGTVFHTRLANSADNHDSGALTLNATGTWTVRLKTFGDVNFSLAVWQVPPVNVQTIGFRQVANGATEVPGERDEWRWQATAGQIMYIDFLSVNVRMDYTLRAPDGTLLNSASNLLERVLDHQFVAPQTGTYSLVAKAQTTFSDLIVYSFQVWDVPANVPQPLLPNQTIAGESVPGQVTTYVLPGTAGTEVLFDIQEDADGGLGFSLVAPNGATLLDRVTTGQLVALPQTGQYQVIVRRDLDTPGNEDNHGPYRFRIQETASPETGGLDTLGTRFYVAFARQYRASGSQTPPDLFLTITGDVDTSGTVQIPGLGFYTSWTVAAGVATTIQLPSDAEMLDSDTVTSEGVLVTALDEVAVYGLSQKQFSTAGFTAIPVDALGTDHVVLGYKNTVNSVFPGGTSFTLAATADNTTVTITPTLAINARPANVPYSITLNRGQTYQVWVSGPLEADLTGTRIVSSQPLSVFGGNTVARVPAGVNAADHLVEQLPATNTWGSQFLTQPLATRSGGDTFRILAHQANTQVFLNGSLLTTLAANQFHETIIQGASSITSSKPVLVAQYSNGSEFDNTVSDPFMKLVVPLEQYQNSYVLSTPLAGIDFNYANLIVPTAAVDSVRVDGAPLGAAVFAPIGASGYSGAGIPLAIGSHQFHAAAGFSVTVYGFDEYDSYGYIGGMTFAPVSAISSLTVSPPATASVASQQALSAFVRDANGFGVPGVRVDFQVTGANPGAVHAFTNSQGTATVVFSGQNPGLDNVTATVAGLSAASTINWVTAVPAIEIFSPTPNSTQQTGQWLLSGRAATPLAGISIVEVLVNGSRAGSLDASGHFFATFDLAAGTNSLVVTAADSRGQQTTTTVELTGTASTFDPATDSTGADLAGLAAPVYSRTSFNRLTRELLVDLRLANQGVESLKSTVVARLESVDPVGVELVNPDATSSDDRPLVLFDSELPAAGLATGQVSSAVQLRFGNRDAERFEPHFRILAESNRAPRIVSTPDTEAIPTRAWNYQLRAVDPDGHTLGYSLVSGPEGMTVNAVTGLVAWTPELNDTGRHDVAIRVADGRGGVAEQGFSLAVADTVNRPPVFLTAPVVSSASGADYLYQALAGDADGDSLAWSLAAAPAGMTVDPVSGLVSWSQPESGVYPVSLSVADGRGGVASQTFTVRIGTGNVIVSPAIVSVPVALAALDDFYAYTPEVLDGSGTPLVFTLTSGPAGMTIDPSSGRMSWVPVAGQTGTASVVWQVANAQGGVAVQSYSIEALTAHPNAPPRFATRPDLIATAGTAWSYPANAVDPDDQTLGYELVVGPAGMTVDPASGQVDWSPANNEAGEHRVLLSATDPAGLKAWQHFYLSVRNPNVAPVFTSLPVTSLVAGSNYVYQPVVTDAEDAVAYSLLAGPPGMTINPVSGLISWTPHEILPGDYPVAIRATDERGLSADQTWTLSILPDIEAPEIAFGSSTVVQIGAQVLVKVLATDNVRVNSLTLLVNGSPVTLVDGQVTINATQPGLIRLEAVASDDAGNVATAARRIRVVDPADMTPPVVEITSPTMLSAVSYLTDVAGTVLAGDLESWRLEFGMLGQESWTTLAQGSGEVNNQVLATFDPTLLANDVYEIRLVAQDFSGNIGDQRIQVLLEGQAKIGNFTWETVDLTVPLAGIPVTIGRRYDTLDAGRSGDFGFGWSLNVGAGRVRETVAVSALEAAGVPALFGGSQGLHVGARVFLTTPEGQRVGFTFDPVAQGGLLGTVWTPRFRADVDTDYELEVDPVALQQGADGRFGLFLLGGAWNPRAYTLVSPGQLRYRYDQFDGIQSVRDRNGVTLEYRADGIYSSTGPAITWARDSQGRITTIHDPEGNAIRYFYNEAGDLVRQTNPVDCGCGGGGPVTTETTMSYTAGRPHHLESVTGPRGNLIQRVVYDAAGRFVALVDADGNEVRQNYDLDDRTFVQTDRLGHPTTFEYDLRGHVTRVTDPLGHAVEAEYGDPRNAHLETAVTDARGNTSRFSYDARGRMTLVERPDGSFTRIEYDSFGNVTRTIGPAAADPGDGFADRVLDAFFAAGEVTGFTIGERLDGNAEPRVFASADVILGPEFDRDGQTESDSDYILLARPGDHVTVGFDEPVVDRAGDDLFIITPRFGGNFTDFGERAAVSVTLDGTNFIPVGEVGFEAYAGIDLADANIAGPVLGVRVTALATLDGNPDNDFYPLTGVQAALGEHPSTRSVYDGQGNLLSFTNAEGETESFTHDTWGRILTATDAELETTELEYGQFADPDMIRFADGSQRTVTRDGKGMILTATSELGHVSSFQYDDSGRPLGVTDALGRTWTNFYDGDLLVRTVDPLGRETRFEYDARDRLVRVIDPLGGVASRTLDANSRIVAVTDALGRTEAWTWTATGEIESHTDAAGLVTEFEYDASSNLTLVRNPRGAETAWAYDSLDRVVSATDALGQVTGLGYDLRGNLVEVTDARDGVTAMEHDLVGRIVRHVDALGGTQSWSYETGHDPASYTDQRGNTTQFEYDSRDRLVRQVDAAGFEQLWDFDDAGRLVEYTDQAGSQTGYSYDANHQLLTVTGADGGVTAFEYDAVGNRTSVTDPLGRETVRAYDALDRVISTLDARGGLTEFDYDAVGNLLSLTDPLGNVTRYHYDARNQVETRTDPLGNADQFAYDAAGNLERTVDRLGRITEFTFDLLDRMTSETWKQPGGATVNTYSFGHDANGNLVSAGGGGSAYAMTYDLLDRMTSVDNAGTVGPQAVLSYHWDAAGNLTRIGDHSGVQVVSSFDARNMLESMQWSGGGIDAARVDFTRNGRGQVTGVERFSDLAGADLVSSTVSTFDVLGRIESIQHLSETSSLVASYAFAFDAASQMTRQVINGDVSDYAFDATGQLTDVDNTARPDEAFVYDANGNRLDGDNVIGPNNQLLSDGTFGYQYDEAGNLVRKTEMATSKHTDYEFDHRNRMVTAKEYSAGGIVLAESSFVYDVFDRMISRTIDVDGAGPQPAGTSHTIYDGENAWADFDAAGNVTARYLFGQELDSNVARWRPATVGGAPQTFAGTAWHLTDHLGSVRDIVDAAGSVIDHVEYDSFGNILSESSPSAGDRFKFTGREWLPSLDLYHYRARFYNPANGLFLSQDPIGFAAGDANLQRYVGNNPTTFTDPLGLMAVVDTGVGYNLSRIGVALASGIAGFAFGYTCGYLNAKTIHGLDDADATFHAQRLGLLVGSIDFAAGLTLGSPRAVGAGRGSNIFGGLVFAGASAALATATSIATGDHAEGSAAQIIDGACMAVSAGGGLAAGRALGGWGLTQVPKSGPLRASLVNGVGGAQVTLNKLVDGLTGLTEQGNRIAAGIRSGQIRVNILGDELFDRAFALKGGAGSSPQAFQLADQIYIRRGSTNLLSDIVHEGTHVLDELLGTVTVPYQVNPYAWEKRAFFYERQFQRAGGGTVEFGSIKAMLNFIYTNY